MSVETRTVSFSAQGEYITQLAREWFFYENKGYEKAVDLLLSCMEGTDTPKEELKRLAEDIIIGRAALAGNTADDTYHLETYEAAEQPEIPASFDIFKRCDELGKLLQETKKDLEKYQEWYVTAMEHIPEYKRNDVLRETGQPVESSYGNTLLSGFIQRMSDTEEHTTEDYGWLEPDGTFHGVDWGEHQEWADGWMKENLCEEEYLDDTNFHTGDYLTERGWVLLHSPSQGIAFPSRATEHEYTKKQREFLFDYYMERNCEKEANALYNDSSN